MKLHLLLESAHNNLMRFHKNPVSPPSKDENIIEVSRKMREDLRKSDREVADLVLSDPKSIMNATIGDAAKNTGVIPSTPD